MVFIKCNKMLTILVHLILLKAISCEESSSYLMKVLTKIQRERLGLLDDFKQDDNTDYIYVDTDDSSPSNAYYETETGNDHDSTVGEETKDTNKLFPYKPGSTLPTNDLIYIYNDTIYLYKAPNSSVSMKKPIQQMQMLPNKGFIPNKMKIVHMTPQKHKENIENTDPENLINMMITEGDENGTESPEAAEGNEDEVDGYYYEYYPLDQIPPEFAETISMLARPTKPVKPGMVTKPKKPMMPIKMVMKKKPKRPVTPLFKAMAVFVGTAVVFIVSILLLPRVKLVKAKSSRSDSSNIFGDSESHYHDNYLKWMLRNY